MDQPVKNRIGGNFVPVRDVAKARDWYRRLLGLEVDDQPLDGRHLCVISMQDGRGLVLDEMPMWGGDRPDGPPTYQTPAFMFDTSISGLSRVGSWLCSWVGGARSSRNSSV